MSDHQAVVPGATPGEARQVPDQDVVTAVAGEPASPNAVGVGVGLAVLLNERLRASAVPREHIDLAVGLAVVGGDQARRALAAVARPPGRLAAWAASRAGRLPGTDLMRRPLREARRRWEEVVADARREGTRTVAAGRAQALRLIGSNVDDVLGWVEADVLPSTIDRIMPYLNAAVVPRVIDGAVPQIRERVLPVIITDLATDPGVRDLMLEQGRGVFGDVAQQVRTSTASADELLEAGLRRLTRRRPKPPTAPAPAAGS